MIGGNGADDGHILKFTHDGKFVEQFGVRVQTPAATTRGRSAGSRRSRSTTKANEAYISDGYGNQRVAVIDMDTGKLKRYWGAYGNKPDDTQPAAATTPTRRSIKQFRNPVHCAEPTQRRHACTCATA